jgi:hypothetical protein
MFHARQKLRQYLPTLGGGIPELSASIDSDRQEVNVRRAIL